MSQGTSAVSVGCEARLHPTPKFITVDDNRCARVDFCQPAHQFMLPLVGRIGVCGFIKTFDERVRELSPFGISELERFSTKFLESVTRRNERNAPRVSVVR